MKELRDLKGRVPAQQDDIRVASDGDATPCTLTPEP